MVLIGRGLVGYFFPTRLLQLAVPLATSFAGVRIVVYLVRKAFAARARSAATDRLDGSIDRPIDRSIQ